MNYDMTLSTIQIWQQTSQLVHGEW